MHLDRGKRRGKKWSTAFADWDACKSAETKPEGKTAYGVKFTADGAEVVLCGAVIPETGPARISLIERRPTGLGTQWLADWLCQRYDTACCVVIDGKGSADVLIDRIRPTWRHKQSVIKPGAAGVVAAASMLLTALQEKTAADAAAAAVGRSVKRACAVDDKGFACGNINARIILPAALEGVFAL